MRIAHFFTAWCAAAMAAATPWAGAQTPQPPAAPADAAASHAPAAADWLNPSAPSRPLQHHSLPTSGGIAPDTLTWPSANAAVGAFPRGHADVLKWEAAQRTHSPTTTGAPANAVPPPPALHHPSGGHAHPGAPAPHGGPQ